MSQNYKIVETMRSDADEMEGWGAGNEAGRTRQAASLIQELAEAAERLATHLDERIDSAPRDAVPVFSGLAELRSILSKLKEA
jgi:hypothetical protein